MYAKLLSFLLFACQIIFNRSHVIHETTDDVTNFTPTSTLALSTLPEGYVRFPDLHSAYKVYTTDFTWLQARDLCIADGAHLAIADTVEKIQRIFGMQSKLEDWISVGIYRSNTTNGWVRVDNGVSVESIPWGTDSPDDTGDCAGISFDGITLVNYHCSLFPWSYACEISI